MYPEKRNLTKTPNQGGLCEHATFTIQTHLWAMMMEVKKRNRVGAGEDSKSKTVKKTTHLCVWSTLIYGMVQLRQGNKRCL